MIRKFLFDDSGATAIEYGILAALMSVAVIAAVTLLGPALMAKFGEIAAALNAPATAPPAPQ